VYVVLCVVADDDVAMALTPCMLYMLTRPAFTYTQGGTLVFSMQRVSAYACFGFSTYMEVLKNNTHLYIGLYLFIHPGMSACQSADEVSIYACANRHTKRTNS
jgi:hypothetical protein